MAFHESVVLRKSTRAVLGKDLRREEYRKHEIKRETRKSGTDVR